MLPVQVFHEVDKMLQRGSTPPVQSALARVKREGPRRSVSFAGAKEGGGGDSRPASVASGTGGLNSRRQSESGGAGDYGEEGLEEQGIARLDTPPRRANRPSMGALVYALTGMGSLSKAQGQGQEERSSVGSGRSKSYTDAQAQMRLQLMSSPGTGAVGMQGEEFGAPTAFELPTSEPAVLYQGAALGPGRRESSSGGVARDSGSGESLCQHVIWIAGQPAGMACFMRLWARGFALSGFHACELDCS